MYKYGVVAIWEVCNFFTLNYFKILKNKIFVFDPKY